MKIFSVFLGLLIGGTQIFCQDMQNRTILKVTTNFNKSWYGVGWVVGNARVKIPNNMNIFGGVGYKQKSWWLESMVQRQWSKVGNNLLLDLRYQKRFQNQSTLYLEGSPFLNKLAFYHFVIFEHPISKKWSIGAETENVLKRGKDSWDAGPRLSRPLGTLGKTKVSAALAYRIHPKEPWELRLYLVFNIPLKIIK